MEGVNDLSYIYIFIQRSSTVVAKAFYSQSANMGSNPGSTTCHLGQVTLPFYTSISP